jgi:hypothetical protein
VCWYIVWPHPTTPRRVQDSDAALVNVAVSETQHNTAECIARERLIYEIQASAAPAKPFGLAT